jgi:hypothetical protein
MEPCRPPMDDWTQWLYIGCAGDEVWRDMHVPQQRLLTFTVRFHEYPGDGEPDLRQKLAGIWGPLLEEMGLSASIGHQSQNPDGGAGKGLVGFVWRQIRRERFASLTGDEIQRLKMKLSESHQQLCRYSLTELVTGELYGSIERVRRWRLDGDGYSETTFEAPAAAE